MSKYYMGHIFLKYFYCLSEVSLGILSFLFAESGKLVTASLRLWQDLAYGNYEAWYETLGKRTGCKK